MPPSRGGGTMSAKDVRSGGHGGGHHGPRRRWPLAPGLVVLIALPACQAGARFTPEVARREARVLIEGGRAEVPEARGSFDPIAAERAANALRSRLPDRLDLDAALAWAARGSREYRDAREQVYLTALAVTGARASWRTRYAFSGGGDVTHTDDGTAVAGRADASLTEALTAGGSFVLSLATDVLRDLTGSPLRTARTLLQSEWILPLARGSGRLVALEPLRQAERELIYALRDHVRFQQAFTLDIASRFYRTLELRDVERNETRTYESLKALVEEQTDKAASGRLPDYQVDQARQELLQAEDRRSRALAAYESALDRLKLDLGLPVGLAIELDDQDLERLRESDLVPAPFAIERALDLAEGRRLDLWNARDRADDACRHVLVARDALRAGVDLRIGAGLTTPSTRPLALDDAALDTLLGIDLDLPLERTAERNEVERRIVEVRRRRRDRQRTHDTIVFEIREAYRNLAEAARSIALQREGLRLADRRVASTELLLERTATIRDLLEAENARVGAANALTRALVDHVLARLELERAVGVLAVAADAQWTWTPPAAAAEPSQAAGADAPLGVAPDASPVEAPAGANRAATTGVASLVAAADGSGAAAARRPPPVPVAPQPSSPMPASPLPFSPEPSSREMGDPPAGPPEPSR